MQTKLGCALLLAVSLTAREPVHARHAMVVTQEPIWQPTLECEC